MKLWGSWCWLPIALTGLFGPSVKAQDYPERYALLIGIDRYDHPDVPRLRYARRDAETLGGRLELQGYHVTILHDYEATRDAIVRQLVLMQTTLRPKDSLIVYYAGHGLIRESNKQVYWLNYSGDPRRPDVGGLRARHVAELVREIPAQRKLILLDHCYSGSIQDKDLDLGDGGRDGSGTVSVVLSGREAIPAELDNDLELEAQTRQATFVVAAARNVAYEVEGNQHGIFTEVLLRAMKGEVADINAKDGSVSIAELVEFVRREVPSLSRARGHEQKPLDKMQSGGDVLAPTWQPFLRTLSPSEVEERYKMYRDRLREWSHRSLLSLEVLTLSESLLERWKTSPADRLGENDHKAIAAVRRTIEDPSRRDEEAASELSEKIRYWSADP